MKCFYTSTKFLFLLIVLSFSITGSVLGKERLSKNNKTSKILTKEKLTPTISGYADVIKTYGDAEFDLVDPTSNSTGAFSYSITDDNVAEVDGRHVKINNAGMTTLTITQAETDDYQSATFTVNFVVRKADATLALRVDGVIYGEDDIVEASYGDVRMFMIETNSDASPYDYEFDLLDDYLDPYIDFSNFPFIKAIKVGTTTLEIRIPSTDNYAGVTQQLTLYIKRKEIFINPVSGQFKRYGDADGELAFTTSAPLVGEDEFFGKLSRAAGEEPGFYAIDLGTLDAGDNYEIDLGEGDYQYEIKKGLQTITFSMPSAFNLNDADYALNATSNRALPINFTSSNTNVAQVYQDSEDGNQWKLKIVGEGTARITALQAGNAFYEGASLFYDINVVSGILSVDLASFAVSAQGNNALLQWTTLTETENKAFQVYKSVDGKNYALLTELNGTGNSKAPKTYQYIDKQPANGINYYQLYQIDFNGKINDLGVKSLRFTLADNKVAVYPNPTTAWVEVDFRGKTFTQLSVFDMNGKQLFQQSINPNEVSKQISFKAFASGIYLIRLQGKTTAETVRVIKK